MQRFLYTLLFGKKPDQFISRFSQTDIIIDAFRCDPPLSQVYMITGIRGSGKTVLMTYIANYLKESDDFIVLNLNPTRDMLQATVIQRKDILSIIILDNI